MLAGEYFCVGIFFSWHPESVVMLVNYLKLCVMKKEDTHGWGCTGIEIKNKGHAQSWIYSSRRFLLIRDLVEEMGPHTAEIAKLLQGRTASDYFVSPHWAIHVGEARKFENCIQIAKQRSCFIQRQIRSKLVSLIRILLVNFRRHRTVHTHCLKLEIVLFLIHSNVTD